MLRTESKSSIVATLWKVCGTAPEKLSRSSPGPSFRRIFGWLSAIVPHAISSLDRGFGFVIPVFYTPYYYCFSIILKGR